jgi:hypothetical protein
MYTLCWTTTYLKETQRGQPISHELAIAWLAHLKDMYPEMSHWIEKVAV